MLISIVHLSDIHIKSAEDPIFSKANQLGDSIKSETRDSDYVVLLTTGDIAYSGIAIEYNLALELYAQILDSVSVKNKKLLFVPGNHDVDHSDDEKKAVRTNLINTVIADQAQIPTFSKTILDAQKDYRLFSDLLSEDNTVDKFCTKFIIDVDGESSVCIHMLNSAWMSEKREIPGKIIPYGYETLSKCDSDINICAMHHTPNWFEPDLHRNFRKLIESEISFMLTGHEHDFYSSRGVNNDGNETVYIEGGVLQESSNSDSSSYNILHIDTLESSYMLTNHSYNSGIYKKNMSRDGWQQIPSTKSKHKITINKDWLDSLNDPGVLYVHPRKSVLVLNDLYVHPDMRDLDEEKKASGKTFVPLVGSEKLFARSIRAILSGEVKSGRTSLCKQLYLSRYDNGFIPIFLSGQDIRSHQKGEIEQLIAKKFVEQYSEEHLDQFNQFDRTKISIIIDDFHRARPNYKYKSLFLCNIGEMFDDVLVTVDELFRFEELVRDDLPGFAKKFHFYELETFGHLLRSKIISKWNRLGQEVFINDEELTRLNDKAKSTIDTVIGKNYVPAFPFFLITLLATMEEPGNKGVSESSYGFYYEYLITGALKRISVKNEDIDAFYNYLTEIAYHFFKNDIQSLTSSQFDDFHKWYCVEYSLVIGKDKYIDVLTSAHILRYVGDGYLFKYKYYYYYFLARHIAQHLSEESAQVIVQDMCSTLHHDESSNVIIFLTHLSKNPFILEQVLKNSKEIFQGNEPTKLDKDVEIINKLIHKLPRIELQEIDVKKNREKDLKFKDKIEQSKRNLPDVNEKEQSYLLMTQLQKAFRHQEIIGQILKNYYGSLKGNIKHGLCDEAFDLCLRSLGKFYSVLNNNLPVIVDGIKSLIVSSGKVKPDKLEDTAKRHLFYICDRVFYDLIKKLAISVGSENLESTYREIVEEDKTVAKELIELSIKLEFFRDFPISDVRLICKKIQNNILPFSVLKRLVINYLYMFPTSIETRQQICDAINISMSYQRAIDAKTTQRRC